MEFRYFNFRRYDAKVLHKTILPFRSDEFVKFLSKWSLNHETYLSNTSNINYPYFIDHLIACYIQQIACICFPRELWGYFCEVQWAVESNPKAHNNKNWFPSVKRSAPVSYAQDCFKQMQAMRIDLTLHRFHTLL